MKILHINTAQEGGAALCARRINNAIIQAGENSRMLFAEGNNLPQGILGGIAMKDNSQWWMKIPILRGIIWRLICILPFLMSAEKFQEQVSKANKKHLYLHIPYSDYKNIAHHPLVEWADIIHLHWVCGFIDYPSFFKEVKKPIVWTLHDKYPIVGLQHYASDFFPIPKELITLDDYCKSIKRKSLEKTNNLHIVALSEESKKLCETSEVLYDFPITIIHNGVDINTFRPNNKQESRKELGLISDACIFLFSSYSIDDENKGLHRIIEALEKVDVPNKLLVVVGMSSTPVPDASFPIILTGLLHSNTKMAKYYSSADFFLNASYEETFSQTLLEALSCGTPVVTTPCGGIPINTINGVVCEGFTPDSIANGINLAINSKYNRDRIREYVLTNYSYEIIANQYIDLYQKLLR